MVVIGSLWVYKDYKASIWTGLVLDIIEVSHSIDHNRK